MCSHFSPRLAAHAKMIRVIWFIPKDFSFRKRQDFVKVENCSEKVKDSVCNKQSSIVCRFRAIRKSIIVLEDEENAIAKLKNAMIRIKRALKESNKLTAFNPTLVFALRFDFTEIYIQE